MTSHLEAFLDAMEISRAPIAAQSMGGRIALELALRNPSRVSALALFGSVGLGDVLRSIELVPHLPAPTGPLSALLSQRWMVALGKAFAYGRRAAVQQQDIDAYWAATQFPDCVPALRQALVDFDWRPLTPLQLSQVGVPVVAVFGTRDRTVRPPNAAARVVAMPRGRLVWVRDAGHVVPEEVPAEANEMILGLPG
jgi:pimeloyl-ACP methyl ester carboxylesterase